MTFILYIIAPILYFPIASYAQEKEFEGNKKTFGHIMAMNAIFKIIGVVVATIITWIILWIFV